MAVQVGIESDARRGVARRAGWGRRDAPERKAWHTARELTVRVTAREWVFIGCLLCLAFSLGMASFDTGLTTRVLLVIWSGMAGVSIPHIRQHRAGLSQDQRSSVVINAARTLTGASARTRADRAERHDLAAALLSIEGGLAALRATDANDKLARPILEAMEQELARVRRLSERRALDKRCEIATALEAVVELRRACGQAIDLAVAPTLVAMPADDLARVVANLLDNADRHADGANVTIRSRVVEDRCLLTVSDDGPGLDPEMDGRVFELGTTTRDGGGVGLHSATTLLERHGGTISLLLQSGPGLHLELDLPLAIDRRGDRTGLSVVA